MQKKRKKLRLRWPPRRIIGVLLVTVLAFFFIFPVFWTVSLSFKTREEVFTQTPALLPRTLNLDNYRQVMARDSLGQNFLNSVIIACATALLCALVAAACGFGICRYPGRTRSLSSAMLALRMIPVFVYMIPFYLLFKRLRLTDSQLGLILCYTTVNLPLAVWLFLGFYQSIPVSIYEAAGMDGCNEWTLFTRIALPLVSGSIVVVLLLVFFYAWNEFSLALVLTNKPRYYTLPIGISGFITNQGERPYGLLAASGMTAMLPALVLTVLLQNQLVKGLTAGAVKG